VKNLDYHRLVRKSALLLLLFWNILCFAQNPTFTANLSVICVNQPVCFTNTSPAGVYSEYYWDFNGDFASDGTETEGGTSCYNYPNFYQGAVYLWGKRISDGIWTAGLQSIVVYAPNTPSIAILPLIECNGEVSLSNVSTINNDGSGHFTFWDFGDGTNSGWITTDPVNHLYATSDKYQVTMTDSNSCGTNTTQTQVDALIINPNLVSSSGAEICQGETVSFSDTSQTNPTVLFEWDFGDGTPVSTLANPSHTYDLPGNYSIKLKEYILNQCADSSLFSIQVIPGPISEFIASESASCDSATIIYTDLSQVTSEDSYTWDFGGGTMLSPANVFYDSAGYYYPTLTIERPSNGCISIFRDTLLIPKTPVAYFIASRVCLNQESQFSDSSYGGIPATYTYYWDFGDGTIDSVQNPTHEFNSPGIQNVYLKTENGYCADDTTISVVVEELPQISFVPSAIQGCAPLSVEFENSTTSAVSYLWIFGDSYSDTVLSPTHIFTTPALTDTNYITRLIAFTSFGCSDSLDQNITVLFTPEAQFISDASATPVCTIDTVQFTSTTIGTQTLEWDFGDGSVGNDSIEVHEYENADHYFNYFEINLIATAANGCPDTSLTGYVTLYPKPRSEFLFDSVNNCHPALVRFYAPIEQDATYTWDWGDGSPIGQTINDVITHPFTNPSDHDSTFFVKLITFSQFGCLDSTLKPVVIHYKPVADFIISPNPAHTNELVDFTNQSENKTGWQYNWVFSEGSYLVYSGFTAPPQIFDTYYDVEVTLYIQSEFECKDTSMQFLDIIPPPPSLGFIPDTLNGCTPLTVSFTDSSEFMDTATYVWDFGDGGFSIQVNPVHTFYSPGLTTVTLTALSLIQTQLRKDTVIDLYFKPSAGFSYYPEQPYIPDQPVKCSPEFPADSLTYFWDFSDGATDTVESPVHFYQDTGVFSITLIATTEHGCVDTLTKELVALGAGNINVPNVFFPGNGGGGNDGDGNGGANIDDGSLDNSIFAPLSDGVLEYHLEIYDRWGEKLFSSDQKNYGWTGFYRGKLCKEDVYVWKVSGMFSNGEAFVKAGTITLLHNE
jgi:PKD repeat protein